MPKFQNYVKDFPNEVGKHMHLLHKLDSFILEKNFSRKYIIFRV